MTWTAIVPLKAAGARKTRLAACLTADERTALSRAMAEHVIATLRRVPQIDRVLLLSPEPPAGADAEWERDRGPSLNDELGRLRAGCGDGVLIVHADLPFLTSEDLAALLRCAGTEGAAIAPDRHGSGTNAIALFDGRPFRFAFGPFSFVQHQAQGACGVVRRPGLAHDIDTPRDLVMLQHKLPRSIKARLPLPAGVGRAATPTAR